MAALRLDIPLEMAQRHDLPSRLTEAELAEMGALSKMNTERAFLDHLHQLGYETADRWISDNFDRIGWESTIDLEERFG